MIFFVCQLEEKAIEEKCMWQYALRVERCSASPCAQEFLCTGTSRGSEGMQPYTSLPKHSNTMCGYNLKWPITTLQNIR